MPTNPPKAEVIRLTGLSREEKLLIEDAAHYARKTIRQWVLDHARADTAAVTHPEAPHA